MFKLITASLFALFISAATVEAGPSKKIFKGSYDGVVLLENAVGDNIVYSPVRFKISIAGVVTGTAYNSVTEKILKVNGSIGKVTVKSGIEYTGARFPAPFRTEPSGTRSSRPSRACLIKPSWAKPPGAPTAVRSP
jgi:hypothetical protein